MIPQEGERKTDRTPNKPSKFADEPRHLPTSKKKFESLIHLSVDLSQALHESEVLKRLVHGLHETLRYDYVGVFTIDPGSGDRVLFDSIGWDVPENWRIPPGQGISERVILDGCLQYVPDVTKDPDYLPGIGTGSEVDLPITVDDEVAGLLVIESAAPDAFDDADFAVLEAVANLAGLALERAYKHEAVEDAEARYRTIFEGIQDGIVVQGLDGQVLDVNSRACEMYGWDREEMLNKSLPDLVPPQHLHLTADDLISGNVPAQPVESINIRADRKEFPVELTARLAAIDGEPVMIVVIRDISERKRAMQALRESEARFRTLVEHAPEAIVVFDAESGRFVEVNENAVNLFGYERDELLNLSPADVSPPTQPDGRPSDERVQEMVQDTLEGRIPIFEWTHINSSGREIPCEIRLVQLPAAGRQLVRGSVTDISRRKEAEARLRASEARYRSLFDRVPIGLYRTSPDGEIIEINAALLDMMGCNDLEEFRARYPSADAVYVDVQDRERWKKAIDKEGVIFGFETRFVRWDGSVIWARDSARVIRDEEGNTLYYEGSVEDITEQKLAEEALRESEERYALAAAAANDGLWDWNLESDEVYFSQRWLSMCGCDDAEPAATPRFWFDRVHPEDTERLQRKLDEHVSGRTPHFECEYRLRHRDGGVRWMLARGLAVFDEEGTATRMAGSQTDITSRKEAEEKLLHDALHDSLTGLANRVLFLDRLSQSMARSRRKRAYSFAVLFLDLDRFKVVNDSLGHGVGDELLIAVGKRLEEVVREVDTVARFGGDEFAVLLDESGTKEEAIAVTRRIGAALQKGFELAESEIFTSASIGIALSSSGYTNVEHMLRDADIAMYRAKAGGKGYEIFSPTMRLNTVRAHRLETELHRAVEREEFEIHYQPIVSLENGQIRGFEALLRWNHPNEGLISADEFVELTEEIGLIKTIGRQVLREACRQLKTWQREPSVRPDLYVSVNVSNNQLLDPSLVEDVRKTLDETGIAPSRLKLEMTESLIIGDDKGATETVQRLHKIGAELYLDDFGTGYSSLSMVHRFPIRALKIDRSFISMIDREGQQQEIVNTIVALAKSLSVPVIAEGVETQRQLNELRALNSDFAQGFLFSEAVVGSKAQELLASPPWASWYTADR